MTRVIPPTDRAVRYIVRLFPPPVRMHNSSFPSDDLSNTIRFTASGCSLRRDGVVNTLEAQLARCLEKEASDVVIRKLREDNEEKDM